MKSSARNHGGYSSVWYLTIWFVIGCAFPLAFQLLTVTLNDQPLVWLLHVGEESTLRNAIENELGDVPTVSGRGMDGQIFYMIARDPLGTGDTAHILHESGSHPRYRYRRIVYPSLAGLGGWLSATATVHAMMFWLAVGSGLAAVAIADMGRRMGASFVTLLIGICNPGTVCAAKTLTADPLATGLAMLGLSVWLRDRRLTAVVILAIAALTKETSLLVAWALALYLVSQRQYRRSALVAVLTTIPIAAWSLFVSWRIADDGGAAHSFTWPFLGLIQAIPVWFQPEYGTNAADAALGLLATLMVVSSPLLACCTRQRWLKYQTLSWFVLGIVLSINVWGRPSNLLRALSPLWIFVTLCQCDSRSSKSTP